MLPNISTESLKLLLFTEPWIRKVTSLHSTSDSDSQRTTISFFMVNLIQIPVIMKRHKMRMHQTTLLPMAMSSLSGYLFALPAKQFNANLENRVRVKRACRTDLPLTIPSRSSFAVLANAGPLGSVSCLGIPWWGHVRQLAQSLLSYANSSSGTPNTLSYVLAQIAKFHGQVADFHPR